MTVQPGECHAYVRTYGCTVVRSCVRLVDRWNGHADDGWWEWWIGNSYGHTYNLSFACTHDRTYAHPHEHTAQRAHRQAWSYGHTYNWSCIPLYIRMTGHQSYGHTYIRTLAVHTYVHT